MAQLTVTIGIPAYYAEKNIQDLLRSLIKQRQDTQKIEKIIVYYDVSGDNTLKEAKEINDKRVLVIDGKIRKGFAHGVKTLLHLADSDVIILLNDDIKITDPNFVEKLAQPFLKEKKVGLVCGNPQAIKSNNFISEAVRSGYNAYKKMGDYIRHGNNVYTCDGKALCFSRELAKSIHFPDDLKLMGNVDHYMYFSCLKNKLKYVYVANAIMYFKCPSTISDFTKWQIRNYKNNRYIFRKAFGKLAEEEYTMPTKVFNKYKFIEFLKNPLGGIFILILGQYCLYKTIQTKNEYENMWSVVGTTKTSL
jgi:cellulose synthase/poly-beta-1,6-N-acetylglucosamine synthase-like glycosyltransferase